ncbi:MAG: arabinan endo-1,5-alpha-L-arabinosidase [Clostridiales bacterium]|nr:arabinan endo-1,5-alpha-L-arabinosidase [Clostridiales bacterium]
MKKILAYLLAIFMPMAFLSLSGCNGNGGSVTDLVIKSEKTATIWEDQTYTLEIDYPKGYDLTIVKGDDNIAQFKQLSNKKFLVTPKQGGTYILKLFKGEELKETITIIIKGFYPKDPKFNELGMRTQDYVNWTEFGAHDPSFIEVDGKYYAFSTDINGTRPGYQIRVSDDLLHWRYAQTAISFDDMQPSDYLAGEGEFQEAWEWCKTSPEESSQIVTSDSGAFSFWAPDIIKGNDGKFWLYYSLTGYFGGSKSCIGLAKSDNILGPYKHDSIIIKSPAGWNTPNCIDAQVIFEENDRTKQMWLVYGSFGKGIHMIELDNQTGRRAQNPEYTGEYNLTDGKDPYYGIRIAGATGGMESPVISYHPDVKVYNPQTKQFETKAYYYLFASYGDLTSSYHIRAARAEKITGPYVDVTGEQLKSTPGNWANSTGNKVMGSFQWDGYEIDFNAPGHNDLYTLENGVNLMVYHCRTYYFENTGQGSGNNYHYLYLSQYAFNEDGHIVVNPNRYANEWLRPISAQELLQKSDGNYKLIILNSSTSNQVSAPVKLNSDGTITGAKSGTWQLKGDYYITLNIDDIVYKGVVMPAWLQEERDSGLTVSALSSDGMALYMNMELA